MNTPKQSPLTSSLLKYQRGSFIIEVLIAVLVLAIGLLAIASLLAMSMKNSSSSLEHSNAVVQSYSMLEVLRADKTRAIIGQYNMPDWTCNNPATDSRVGMELSGWISNLHSEIGPTACGKITCSSLTCTVGVRWNDERATGGKNAKEYLLSTRL